MAQARSPGGGDASLAAEARRVLAALTDGLQDTLRQLAREGDHTPAALGKRLEVLRAAQGQLTAVIELEGRLEDHGTPAETGHGALDLDAARREIRERLARLRAHAGGGGLSGGPE